MRILIDLQAAQTKASGYRGVGRYSREIVKAFICAAQRDNDNEIFIVLNGYFEESCFRIKQEFKDILPLENFKVWNWYPDIIPAVGQNLEIFKAPIYFHEWFLHQFEADVVWSLNFQEGLGEAGIVTSIAETGGSEFKIGTLYDLTPMLDPKAYPQKGIAEWYETMLKYCQKCDALVTCSEFSKEKIAELLDYDKTRIVVATPGIDRKYFFSDFKVKKVKFILYIGGASEYKNVIKLIEAYALLSSELKSEYKLVLGGKEVGERRIELEEVARKNEIRDNDIIIKGYLEEDEMVDLQRKCTLFVFPSLAEGFGMPPIEAGACGAIVLVSNRTSLPEVVGTIDATFEPTDAKDIANKITRVLTDKKFARQIYEFEQNYFNNFNWKTSGEKIYNFFEKTVKIKRKRPVLPMEKYIDYNKLPQDDLYIRKMAKSFADSKVFAKKSKVCVDLSAVVIEDYVTGIQRVCNALIENFKQILKNDSRFDVIPVYSLPGRKEFAICDILNGKYCRREIVGNQEIIQFNDGDFLIMPDLHLQNIITKKKYLISLVNRGIKVFTLLHDLIPVNYPQFYTGKFTDEFKQYLIAISNFSGVIANSKSTLIDYKNWILKQKIELRDNFIVDYFHLGSDLKKANPTLRKKNESEKLIEKLKANTTFLMVGTIEPRKKHEQVLDAMNYLWKEENGVNLVLVGRYGWKMDEFLEKMKKHKQYGEKFFWLEGVSDEYLDEIYNVADAVIVASECEGFGLPVVEASYHNKPVILRDIPVFREIANDSAFYFDTMDAEVLAKELHIWIELNKNQKIVNSEGVEKLTWEEAAKDFLKKINLDFMVK